MDTDGLINELAANATPVRPLPNPWMRTGLWLAIAFPYVALVIILMSPRPDLATQLADPRFQVEQVAALATAILAAAAAFTCVVSGTEPCHLSAPSDRRSRSGSPVSAMAAFRTGVRSVPKGCGCASTGIVCRRRHWSGSCPRLQW